MVDVRVVLDTNILVSAAMKPDGLEAALIALQGSGGIEACVTEEILAEYREVLLREKFRQWRVHSEAILNALAGAATRVKPANPITAAVDEDDNRFLECAEAAGASFLITGNLRHFPALWKETRVLNARMFFSLIGTKEQTGSRPDL